MSKRLDVAEFKSIHLKIDLMETLGTGDWRIELYHDKDSNENFSKGPFDYVDKRPYLSVYSFAAA